MGLVISDVTETALPPSCPAMSPQKFSAATTSTTPCGVEATAGRGATALSVTTALNVAIVPRAAQEATAAHRRPALVAAGAVLITGTVTEIISDKQPRDWREASGKVPRA